MINRISHPEFVVPAALLMLAGGVGILYAWFGVFSAEEANLLKVLAGVGLVAGSLVMLRSKIGTLLYFLILGGGIILAPRGLLSGNPADGAKALYAIGMAWCFLHTERSAGWTTIVKCDIGGHGKDRRTQT